MSVIQQIQEKYAKLMAVIIALALIIFVVMLAFENGGALFNGGNSTVGKINGEKIDIKEFQEKVKAVEANIQQQQQGYGASGAALTAQAVEQAWNMEISQQILKDELSKLGMVVGKKELNDILFGANPPQDLKNSFTDPATGVYNAEQARQQINQLKKGNAEQKKQLNGYLDYVEQNRLQEKYISLLGNSSNTPKWLIEKQNADNSQLAKITFVRKLYADIADSTVKVSDKEIEDYISKHKKDFKQTESRGISYVAFSTLPTAADTQAAKAKLEQLIPEFKSAANIKEYLEAQGVTTYYDGYISGNRIQIANKDSIFKTPIGQVYGPYVDGATWTAARVIGVKTTPDTVKVRHILLALQRQDPQSGQAIPLRDSATAYKLADSLRTAIANGTPFDSLVAKFSDDPGSKDKGGVYDSIPSGQMVPEFNDFIFGNPVGTKGIVNTQFGAHYIEILSQKGSAPAYNIAYLSEPIESSSETRDNADREASKFAAQSRNQKEFEANADKLQKQTGINRNVATNITPTAAQVMGLGESRQFVKNIYKAKRGEVLTPERVGENYVVALVTEVNEEGTQSIAQARIAVEPILRNKKKAEQIKQQLGAISTVEAAATKWGKTPEVADSVRFSGTAPTALGYETKVIGAAFNKANANKTIPEAIEGVQGVYVVRVDNVSTTSVADANVAEQRKQKYQQAKMQSMYQSPLQVLRESARIKDYRADFF